ncbi:hypothetical protein [Lacihabitans sp. CS3-21]|uniref:hypothetical protein n=1 Tax=Lacihabitans sp. CS3-21 TaxID=2487332 RepID=UPI0020CE8F70|nr:hypothetical protein [Lacihabitans sp. CS3-21]MCP9747551.1 hypothetical protein [Lacihabitans sp. CS3-21]
MKTFYKLLFLFLFLGVYSSIAQENVGIGTKTPNNSAILDLESADKGLLIPRLTIEKRNNILSPATGLMIYQTNEKTGFYFYNGSTWKPLSEGDAKAVALDAANWSKTGDAGTNPATNFLGTTDNQPLIFKIASTQSGYLAQNSNTLFGFNSGGVLNVGVAVGNTAFGFNNLAVSTGGNYNTAIGYRTLVSNLGGSNNVALGAQALQDNTTGTDNMAIGLNALRGNIAGGSNVAIGGHALYAGTGGYLNTSVGSESGFNATGSRNVFLGYQAGYNELNSDKLYIANSNTATPLVYGDFSAKFVTIGDVPASNLKRIDAVTAGGYNLLVKGGILTEKVKVALVSTTDWADYVFEKSYKEKMMTLEEVEKFTISNKHLPNVPSAQDMVDKGMEVGQTSKMFMEKIEELTLYMIELNKEVKALKAENELLKKK